MAESPGTAESRAVHAAMVSDKTPELDSLEKAKVDDARGDTKLKGRYANWSLGILCGQLFVMNTVFIFVGLHILHFHDFVLNLYMGGTLAEVFGVVLVIARYLFPRRP